MSLSVLQPLRRFSSRSLRALALKSRSLTAPSGSATAVDPPHHIARFFTFWPSYFSRHEQRLLLSSALHRLDSMDSVKMRRRRSKNRLPAGNTDDLQQLFGPDELYDFHEGHFDGVIHQYREMHLTNWPTDQFPGLSSVLERLYALCPSQDIQTHLLHLSTHGEILPHVDNLSASGSWILGVSLGDERTLRMAAADDKRQAFELALLSGSVYLQKDDLRYQFEHSVSKRKHDNPAGNQRLSIMVRDRLSQLEQTPTPSA